MVVNILFFIIGLLGLAFLFLAIFAFKLSRKYKALSEQIHVTAHECYNVGWDRAMEHVKIHKEIRNAEIEDFIVNYADGQ